MKPSSLFLSIDLETLSTESNAAIIAIGACTFTEERVIEAFQVLIDPMLTPGHRQKETIDWWGKQDPAIKEAMWGGTEEPAAAAVLFSEWLEKQGPCKEIWANPPSFDVVILRNWYQSMGSRELNKLLPFRSEMDYRTMKKVAAWHGVDAREIAINPRAHSAVDDAITQANVIRYWKKAKLC